MDTDLKGSARRHPAIACGPAAPPRLQTPRLFDGDNQFAEATEDIVQRALFRLDMEASDLPRQRGEQGTHLQPGEMHAKAYVRSGAEAHMAAGIVAPDVETIRVWKLSRIAVG